MRNLGIDSSPTPRHDSAGDGHFPAGRKDDPRRSVAGGTGLGRGVDFRDYFVFAQFMKPAADQNRAVQTLWRIRAAWIAVLCFTVSCGALTARAFTSADADTLLQAHTRAFYRVKDGRA